jgi:glycosyltransferase involved in cell wall biosynthesis
MKQPAPFFSIILTTYNRPLLLPRAIESVWNQTFEDWELLIVDDGSEQPYSLEGMDPVFKAKTTYLRQPNLGVSAARNAGIAKARGQYLGFLDDDDYYYPHHLQAHYEQIQRKPQAYDIYRSQTEMHTHQGIASPRTFFQEPLWLAVWKWGDNLHPYTFHRRIFAQILFDPYVLRSEDTLFLLEALTQFSSTLFQETTVVYHMYTGGKSQSLDRVQILRALQAEKRYREKLGAVMEARLGPSHYKHPMMRLYLGYFYKALLQKRYALALEFLIKSLPYTQRSTLKHLFYLPIGVYKTLT